MIAELEAGRLLRYATLAASSHNTQPWRFELDGDRIRVFADTSRQLRVADPDRRELFLSVGCAVENLVVAAEHYGYATTVTYDEPDNDSYYDRYDRRRGHCPCPGSGHRRHGPPYAGVHRG